MSDRLAASPDIYADWYALDTASRRAAIKEQVKYFTVGPGRPGTRSGPMHNVIPAWRED